MSNPLTLIPIANSSGQGYCTLHTAHPFHETSISFGYIYSHSVFVNGGPGNITLHHCYKFGAHTLSFPHLVNDERTIILGTRYRFYTKVSCGSGRQYTSVGVTGLARHLKSKRSRYNELKG